MLQKLRGAELADSFGGMYQHCKLEAVPALTFRRAKKNKKTIDISWVSFRKSWPPVAQILDFGSDFRNLYKKTAPEPDSEVQILKSKANK